MGFFSRLVLILAGVVLSSGIAQAEHKLLITDVLDKGQAEVEAETGYGYSSYDLDILSFPVGKVKHRVTATDFSLDFGLGHDLQIGVSIPYFYSDRTSLPFTTPLTPSGVVKTDGWGDFVISGKYRLLGDSKKGLTIVGGLNVKLDTANMAKEGTGTTDYNPYLAISSVAAGGKLRPYAYYSPVFRTHGARDSHNIGGGMEFMVTKSISLVPSANIGFNTDSSSLEGYQSFRLGLANYIEVFSNFYLIPSVDYNFSTSTRTKDNFFSYGTMNSYSVALGLYYLFK